MENFNFSYDSRTDDLFIYDQRFKSKGSVEIGNIILDYSAKKEIVAIQLLSASKLINDMVSDAHINMKQFLSDLTDCNLDIKTDNNLTTIKLYLTTGSKKITSILSMPIMTQHSPAVGSV